MSVSSQLGEPREIRLPQGTISYRERGTGEPIVFVHGLVVNGDLWRKVVPDLADGRRCIAPDWPLGSHSTPLGEGADLSPPGLARLIADFLAALELENVTLIGNDTGTGLSQIVATEHPERIGRLVLTTGDAFTNFPPHLFKPLILAGYAPATIDAMAAGLRSRRAQRQLYGPLAKRLDDPEIFDSYAGPAIGSAAVRRDIAHVLREIRPRYTARAAERLPEFQRPALIAWAPEDRFFPNAHASRLAALLPDARLEAIWDSYAFSSEDQPERLTQLITDFVG